MTGDYLEDSGTVTASNDVLVSVQVFPLGSASTAQQIYNDLAAHGSWDFGIWCPMSGAGSDDCGGGYSSAFKWQFMRTDHRYLIQASALYTDLTPDSSVKPWVYSAALKATDVSGPENYSGNQ